MRIESRYDRESAEELLHHDHYTPEELSSLLGISVYGIQQAARDGRLKAHIVDHHILSIRREDVLNWLEHVDVRD